MPQDRMAELEALLQMMGTDPRIAAMERIQKQLRGNMADPTAMQMMGVGTQSDVPRMGTAQPDPRLNRLPWDAGNIPADWYDQRLGEPNPRGLVPMDKFNRQEYGGN